MDDVISAPLFAGGLFLVMLICLEVGRRATRAERSRSAAELLETMK